ncbi:hypothetical protein CDAR_299961 [Caerostris darwini]|uniref:Prolactin receptor n=1 Tax=Caerostris darwini TaxID=1538125 RepID=A0AAV4W5A7_9ARAC|nr:hypothetical protein CDAR_299961 [Caerostris darwini]
MSVKSLEKSAQLPQETRFCYESPVVREHKQAEAPFRKNVKSAWGPRTNHPASFGTVDQQSEENPMLNQEQNVKSAWGPRTNHPASFGSVDQQSEENPMLNPIRTKHL